MVLDIIQILIAAFAATLVWFVVGAVVYMNPVVDKIYSKYEDDPAVKNRKDVKKFILNTFLYSILIQCVFFAFIYAVIKPVLPVDLFMNTLYFGGILLLVKIVPRFLDMFVQSKYPLTLLSIELVNGAIGSFVIALVFALLL